MDTESPLAEIVGDYDALIVRSATKVTAEVIDPPTKLKVVGRAGVGVDNVDVDAATRRGIVVANAPESNVVSAAEHTIGLLVALARNIPQAHAAMMQGRWERSQWGGVELADKTLGVLGFGRIGRQVARRAQGLAMKVLAYDPFVAAERFRELGVDSATLDEVLARVGVPHAAPAADRRDARVDRRRRDREDAGRRADRQRGPRRADRRGRADRGARVGQGRRRRPRRVRRGAVLGPAAEGAEHRRHAAPRRLDRGGAGPRGRDRRRAGAAALEGGLVTNAVNIPTVGAEDLEVLGPYIPLAAKLGRLAMELARRRGRAGSRSRLRRARRVRHAAPDRRRAERRLPGPHRPAGQLRQRAARRRRARDRGDRGASAARRATSRISSLSAADGAARRRHDDRHERPAVARLGARLRARDGARAAAWCCCATTTSPA